MKLSVRVPASIKDEEPQPVTGYNQIQELFVFALHHFERVIGFDPLNARIVRMPLYFLTRADRHYAEVEIASRKLAMSVIGVYFVPLDVPST